MIIELLLNVALVVALGVVIQAVGRHWGLDTLVARLISGMLFAVVTLLVMMTPVALAPGLVFDGRSIVICAAGVLGGPVVASIAALAAIGYRAYLGGPGVTMGVAVIVEAAVLGSAYYHLRRRDRRLDGAPYLYALGVLVHVIMIALVLTLPVTEALTVARRIALPVLALYPLALVTVCKLLLENEDRLRMFTSLERSESSLKASNLGLETITARLVASLASVIDVVGKIVESRDPHTAGHQRRVSELSVRIAGEMGMTSEQVEDIRIAGLIHDVGKISVPAEILSRPGTLTPIEFELVKCHAESGYDILTSADMDMAVTEMVRQHHERGDGSGYPRGLRADETLQGAKVLVVADVVEAMCSHRPYRPSLGVDPALAEIERGAGVLYDRGVVAACVRCFREGGFAFSEV